MNVSDSNKNKAGCGCAFPLILTALILGIVASVYYFADVHGKQMLHAGDETAFDPIAALPYATQLAGPGLQFVDMRAKYVRSDGTLDLTAEYHPDVSYRWIGNVASAKPRPVGVRGGSAMRRIVTVHASKLGFEFRGTAPDGASYYDLNLGLRRLEAVLAIDLLHPTDPPTCSAKKLWKAAIANGAPGDAVAMIDYNASGYSFEIEGTKFKMKFGRDCAPRK